MRILGLDPGLQTTGWGVIEQHSNCLIYVAHGIVKSSARQSLAFRLTELHQGLAQVIAQYNPDQAAVEETFVNKNPISTLKLGMARGVVLLAPALAGLTVGEYAPNRIKKAVVGSGHAQKFQVERMVQYLLTNCGMITADAADALAVAICHAHYRLSGL